MAFRGWTAVVLLFAVLAMHGLQCGSAADGVTHAGAPPGVALAVSSAPSGQAHMADAGAMSSSPAQAGHERSAAPVHDGAPLHGTAHLWAVCLAVLAAGLALLLALVFPRLIAVCPAALLRALFRPVGALPLRRPPDLDVLCLLRI